MLQRIIELLKPDVSPEAKITGVGLFIGKQLDKHKARLDTLEIKTLIPLKDGRDGQDGKIGPRGLDGRSGKDGADGKDGRDGKDGAQGKDGKKGAKGISVVDAEIAADDHLVLKLSDGKIIDAGELPNNSQQIIATSLQNQHVVEGKAGNGTYTVLDTDELLLSTGGTITFPLSTVDREIEVVMTTTVNVTINLAGSDLIYSELSVLMNSKGMALHFKGISGGWILI